MEDKERNLFNLDDLDESSSELKSKDESSSQNLTLDEFETNELDKEELLTQKIKEAAAKRKLTAQNGENEKRKWTKIFERKNVDDENEPILTMDEVDASSRSNNAIRYNPDLN